MENTPRKIAQIITPQAVVEGAGVRLKRSIGTRALDYLDPFLLLDHFQSTNAADYQAGFPLHPHRGIETVTYLLSGAVRHRDTLGNSGEIQAGDIQWMTAGRGIMHEEMPQVRPEGVAGFQLVNLPAKLKMTAPRYQNIAAAEIPVVRTHAATIRVIAGTLEGITGPVTGIAADPSYLDVEVLPGATFVHPVPAGHAVFAYVFQGVAKFGAKERRSIEQPKLLVWSDGEMLEVKAEETPVRFLLVSGEPLRESIARYGPFVMNTREEITQTLREIEQGTFAT
jgi:redox-sensitive bicupin YhaK (pirin superfamily)